MHYAYFLILSGLWIWVQVTNEDPSESCRISLTLSTGMAVLSSAHEPSDIFNTADDLIVLKDGQLCGTIAFEYLSDNQAG